LNKCRGNSRITQSCKNGKIYLKDERMKREEKNNTEAIYFTIEFYSQRRNTCLLMGSSIIGYAMGQSKT
jgi:hypothetical protein